jgi:hypothetical protein
LISFTKNPKKLLKFCRSTARRLKSKFVFVFRNYLNSPIGQNTAKKTNNNNFFQNFFWFRWLKNVDEIVLKIKKNYHWTTTIWCMFARSRLCFLLKRFFLLIFKDCPLENFDRFLKIALPFICLNTSVWARWKGIFKRKIQKIKKPNNNNFFRFFFLSWFETELLKMYIF